MAGKWHKFIDGLKDDGKTLAKDELKDLVKDAKADTDAFIKKQGVKLERYLNQLAAGDIKKKEFEGYVKDLTTLTLMQSASMAQAAQTRAHNLAMNIASLVLKGLIGLLA
jgi:hypothetical protein